MRGSAATTVVRGSAALAEVVRRFVLLALVLCSLAFAMQARGQHVADKDAEEEAANTPWHLLNTAIFFAIAGYGIAKVAPAFFNARTADIQKAVRDATGLKMQAEYRSSEIDRKMATLPAEIERLREQSRVEMEREEHRRRQETERDLRLIDAGLAAEIEGMRSESQYEISRQATVAALVRAEQQLREGAGADGASQLGNFVQLVERGRAR